MTLIVVDAGCTSCCAKPPELETAGLVQRQVFGATVLLFASAGWYEQAARAALNDRSGMVLKFRDLVLIVPDISHVISAHAVTVKAVSAA